VSCSQLGINDVQVQCQYLGTQDNNGEFLRSSNKSKHCCNHETSFLAPSLPVVIPSHSDSGTSSSYQFFNVGASKLPRSKTGRFTTSVDPLEENKETIIIINTPWDFQRMPSSTLLCYHFSRILLKISQFHIQQLHGIAHSIEDGVAGQPFSGGQHLLMGELDFTNMAFHNNVHHLQFREMCGGVKRGRGTGG
jgi:hypothetical protein